MIIRRFGFFSIEYCNFNDFPTLLIKYIKKRGLFDMWQDD